MKTAAIISQTGGAGKTTVAIHLAVIAEQCGFRTAVFDLDPQASATSWADKRKSPAPAVVPAQASRLSNLLEQAADQSADLVLIDSAPNADSARRLRRSLHPRELPEGKVEKGGSLSPRMWSQKLPSSLNCSRFSKNGRRKPFWLRQSTTCLPNMA